MDMLNQKQKIIAILLIILAIGVIIFQYINSTKEVYSYEDNMNIVETDEDKMIVQEKEEKIIVHVTGAVKKEGIVEVKENARINDVIQAAGGATEDADLSDVNLAYIVEDGQKLYIPSKVDNIVEEKITNEVNTNNIEESKKEIVSSGPGENVTEEGNIGSGNITNINKVGLEGLKSLPGIRGINGVKNT